MASRLLVRPAVAAFVLLGAASPLPGQTITTPRQQFGFDLGDDYMLADYRQIAEYWRKLARESDRMILEELGRTAEGRVQLMAVVSSPENLRNLARLKAISARLALADGVSDAEARALAHEGKAIVWIDGGLHATETLGAQQLAEMVFQLVSRDDPETLRFLDDVVVLLVHANPDGNDLVADWYMRNPSPTGRSLAGLPRLYQKYIGHDNNRDFFASTQPETENLNRALYHEWYPQILYNHHQTGPAGTVVYSPPFRDPYNYHLDPLMLLGIQAVGTAMHTRLAVEGKGGATMRSGGPYDGWWNGGIRNTATFHNTIALLTEMIGSPTPMRIPFVAQRQVPGGDLALPIAPQPWHFRQSVDYSISLNRAVLDYASRMREDLLYNRYVMGRNAIRQGREDSWTANPRRIATAVAGATATGTPGAARDSAVWSALHTPANRDPRGYIIPADQPDFLTAIKFVNALRETNITVHRASAAFTVAGREYPAGSLVVFTAQAFRPHVLDMFEPQFHPDVFLYAGAPPTPPYDNAGWTLALQMGVHFDRILDPFSGPFVPVAEWNLAPPPGSVQTPRGSAVYLTDARVNDAFAAVNHLLGAGAAVRRTTADLDVAGRRFPAGSFMIRPGPAGIAGLRREAQALGVSFTGIPGVPAGALPVRPRRIGLWDRYGGSMESGWTRWILEQFGFPYQRVYAPELDGGGLAARYDVLVFVDGAFPDPDASPGQGGPGGNAGAPDIGSVPLEYRSQAGAVSVARTVPQLRVFLEGGGTVVAIGSSAAALVRGLQLPVESQLRENGAPLPRTRYFVPGSILEARIDTSRALARGLDEQANFFFDNSPVFRLTAEAGRRGVVPIAWFDSDSPLRSGWAWGQQYLRGGVAALEAPIGQGRLILFGPEILQRAQPHGTFKLFFNALLSSPSTAP